MQNDQRSQRMMMNGANGAMNGNMNGMNPQQYQNLMRMQNSAGANNELKRQALNNQNRYA